MEEKLNYKLVNEDGKLSDMAIACHVIMDERIGTMFRKLLRNNSRNEISKFLASYCAGVCDIEGIEVNK